MELPNCSTKRVGPKGSRVGRNQPAKALALEHESQAKLEKMGVRFVKDVQKDGFMKIAEPLQNKLSKDLGPYAVKLLTQIRNIK